MAFFGSCTSLVRSVTVAAVILLLTAIAIYLFGRRFWFPTYVNIVGEKTVQDIQRDAGHRVRSALTPDFEAAGLAYPAKELTILAFKDEKLLELWGRTIDGWVFIKEYPVLAASGTPGPKLCEGDRQVPEGIYGVEYFNPNSSFYLSIKLDYPNAFDRTHAAADGRTQLGGDIFIHGNALSIGCLAMGDAAAEELFVLSSLAGRENIRVTVSPTDMRKKGVPKPRDTDPSWLPELYSQISKELNKFRR